VIKYGCHTGEFDSVKATVVGGDGREDPCQQADVSSNYVASRLEVYFTLINDCPSTAARTKAWTPWRAFDFFSTILGAALLILGV